MKVRRVELGKIEKSKEKLSACIGYFDGMHLGHMQLVRKAKEIAELKNIHSALITFDPDPWVILKGMKDVAHITSMEERIEIGRMCELDEWIIVEFTKELSQLSYQEFEEKILQALNIDTLVCGFDYHYGHKGSGSIETLKQQHHFDVEVVSEYTYQDEKVSSTRIQNCIEEGNMSILPHLLGRPYTISGVVVKGNQKGREYGYPTANVMPLYQSLLPKRGVYIGYTLVHGRNYKSMINIGHNPTFNYRQNISIESYCIGLDEDIYDEVVTLTFIEKIRDEEKFASKELLLEQLNKDVEKANALK